MNFLCIACFLERLFTRYIFMFFAFLRYSKHWIRIFQFLFIISAQLSAIWHAIQCMQIYNACGILMSIISVRIFLHLPKYVAKFYRYVAFIIVSIFFSANYVHLKKRSLLLCLFSLSFVLLCKNNWRLLAYVFTKKWIIYVIISFDNFYFF